jgi:hypothetical protein
MAIWIVLLEFGTAAGRGLFAQSTKAELFGLIADPSGLPVPDATIELENTATEVKRPRAARRRTAAINSLPSPPVSTG